MNRAKTEDLRVLAEIMDNHFKGPFGWRFGWDGLIGLVPVVGDVITSFVSLFIILRAAQLGCPGSVLSRMGLNLVVENLVDIVPFAGNLFDFVWKANIKNLRLVEQYLEHPEKTARRSGWVVGLSVAAIVILVIASLILAVWSLKIILGGLADLIFTRY